jgi:acetoin utilization deacetylase AcuC-like enzyme
MLTAYYHPGYAAPIGKHVMPIRKFGMVAEAVRAEGLATLAEPAPVTEADLLRVHTRAYVDAVRTGQPRALAESQKFPWSRELFLSVCLTGGGCLAACREALRTRRAAAGLVSGFHHAHADHGEGFCTFNGLVVANDALRAAGELRTAAILDMDLHYGNGTASLAASRPYVFVLSIYGNDYANNTAYRDVTVRHHEDGENDRSAALPAACDRATMLQMLEDHLPSLASNASGKPDLLIYQAGADPYLEDPYSPLKLDHDDLLARDRRVFEFARDEKIPIAWVLAGGYTEDVTKVVRVHVNTFRAYRDVFS